MKKKIALVTGGFSGEAEISYKSAITVANNIDLNLFDYYTIDINPSGWFYNNENNESCEVNKTDFTIIFNQQKIVFDVVLMCIHGTPGEDGKLQGYFDLLQIPYTSCDTATSALTFNKRYTLAVAAFGGIKVAKSVHLFKDSQYTIEKILQQIQTPVFVKPNNGGSSLGMSKVVDSKQLQTAINKAFEVDDQVLVEEMIQGREFTIGVYKSKNELIALPITEIITQNEFFDYEAKYLGKSEEITPASITDSIKNQIEEAAKKIYQLLNCRGIVRIDFIYNEKELQPYMLEVNTVPGQSQASIVPQQVLAKGLTLKEFYTDIIQNAIQ
ncbi:MAG: D-alanine--D-alanine ligase [Chitinophagaceae bacterium]|nr:D-alanine--D-alanine ligase [Chitinophagaceae bacterium]